METSQPTTLFYDADCGICTASVDWLMRAAEKSGAQLDLVAYQDPSAPSRFPMVDWDHTDFGVQTIEPGGRIRRDSSAVAVCFGLLPAYRWFGVFMTLPIIRAFSQLGYRLVADNRRTISRWLGLDACKIPTRKRPAAPAR